MLPYTTIATTLMWTFFTSSTLAIPAPTIATFAVSASSSSSSSSSTASYDVHAYDLPAGLEAALTELPALLPTTKPTTTATLTATIGQEADDDEDLGLNARQQTVPAYTPIVTKAPDQDAQLASLGYVQQTYYTCNTIGGSEHCGWHIPLVKVAEAAAAGRVGGRAGVVLGVAAGVVAWVVL